MVLEKDDLAELV